MAKGILDKVDTNPSEPVKGAGLSYQGMEQYNPSPSQKPAMGTLKKILSATKESEQFSPYKKSAPKPTKIERKTEKPSPMPVEPQPLLTEDILKPVTEINKQANSDFKTAVEATVAKKFKSGTIPEDVYRANLEKGVTTGEFKIVDSEDGGREIIRSAPGFLGGFVEGWNDYWNGLQESIQSYNPFTSEEEKIALRETRRRDRSIILQQQQDTATEYGQMTGAIAGQLAPMVLSGGGAAVATRAAGLAAGAINISKANSAVQTAIGALNQANQSEDEAYNLMRDKGLSPEDANEVAKANRLTYATTGALESALSSLADAKIAKFFSAGTKTAGDGFLNATKKYLNKLKEPAASLALDASVAGMASSIRDLATESTTGVDLQILDRAWENAKQELIAGGAIATVSGGAGYAGRKVDKWFKSQATNYLSTLDKKFVTEELNNKVQLGEMTQEQVNAELEKIDKWNEIRKNNPNVPQEKMPTVYGLILAKNQMQEAMKNADPATGAVDDFTAKIDDIDKRIKTALENPDPLAAEVDDDGVELPSTIFVAPPTEVESKRAEIENLEKQYNDLLNIVNAQNRPVNEPKTKEELDLIDIGTKLNKLREEIKPKEDATTISEGQQQEGGTEGDIVQRQGIEGEQTQAPNEPNNSDSNIVSQEGQKVEQPDTRPEVFSTQEQKNVFEKMRNAAEQQLAKKENDNRGAAQKALAILKGSEFFKSLDKNQREAFVRASNEYFSGESKAAPGVSKLLGDVKDNKITVKEKVALKRLLKFGETTSKGAIKFSKEVKAGVLEGLKSLGRRGIIKVAQLNSIMNKMNNLDVTNDKSVQKFADYVTKKIADANYDDKIKEANRLRTLILKNARRESGQSNLSEQAKAFAALNPANASNLDEYINVAGNVLKGVAPSKSGTVADVDTQNIKGRNPAEKKAVVNFSQPFSEKDIAKYTKDESAAQQEMSKAEKMEEYQDLVDKGIISSDMTFDEMNEIIDAIEGDPKTKPAIDKEKDIRNYISTRFQTLSAMAKAMLQNGTDGFGTDLDVEITAEQKRVINDVLNSDVKGMSLADAYRTIEGLSNFVTNGKSSGLDAVTARYKGAKSSFDAKKAGFKSRPLKLYFSNRIGRLWASKLDSLPIKLIKMFGSNSAPKFARYMGLYDLEVSKNKAILEHFNIENEFINTFQKKTPNGQEYNTASNVTERGIIAFATRTVDGTDTEVKAEFDRRKRLIEGSIEALRMENTGESNSKADLYQTAYDKILKDSKNIDEVRGKADKSNLEIVDWWTNKWNTKYDKLRDVSINVYNQDLGRDNNYNPDMYRNIKESQDDSDIFENSAFSSQFEYIPQKKSGTLIKSQRPENLPDGKYIDLSFDMNNTRAMKSALVDINTAANIRQVKAFLDAPTTKQMINGEDLSLLRNSTAEYIKRSRGMESLGDADLASAKRVLNSASRLISSTALVGLGQPIKQTVPLIIKTLVSTKGNFDIKTAVSLMFYRNTPIHQFLERSGYGIATRGAESSTSVMGLDSMIKQANSNIAGKFMDGMDKWNDFLLKNMLSNPDKWVARASWITYYKSRLDEMGVDSSKIDWNTHEVNTEAADYAESMVNTQQGVSDRDLMGSFMGSRDAGATLLRTIALPFSNFSMNAKGKTQSDVINSFKGATKEDRVAARLSLAGTVAEMLVFNAINGAVGITAFGLANEDEPLSEKEQDKAYEQVAKSAVTNFASDLLSPLPQLNSLVSSAINALIDAADQDTPDELKFRLYADEQKPFWQDFGLYGIGAKKFLDFKKAASIAKSGEFNTEYFGKSTTKTVSDDDKQKAKVAAILQALSLARIIPVAEVATYANKIIKGVEKRAMNAEQAATANAVKQFKVEGATKLVDGKNISEAIAKSAVYKDPESRAKYLIELSDKYGDDFAKAIELAEAAKYLDKPTMANMTAILEGNDDNIKVARLFSYKNQDSRVSKLINLRDQAIEEDRLIEFYQSMKYGLSYKLLNTDGLSLYVEKLKDELDQDEEELDLLISVIED